MLLEKTLESPLNCKEIQPVHPKGDQSWVFIGRTDAEAETPILWPSDVKNWLTRKDPDAGKDWRQEEKGMTENEMVGWHHQLDGHEWEKALQFGDGQGGLVCCSPWGHKQSDSTEWLKWTELKANLDNSVSLMWNRILILILGCRHLTKLPSYLQWWFIWNSSSEHEASFLHQMSKDSKRQGEVFVSLKVTDSLSFYN